MIESIREHLTETIIYNKDMSEINSKFNTQSPGELIARMEVLQRKLGQLNGLLGGLMAERQAMENKISDAQTRIQKILNKLPQTTDTRQLNLLDNGTLENSFDE
jgi:predicted  nucleic acid-binding Zn-ribbon protein